MTIPGSAIPLLLRSAAPAEYQVSRSVRFNSSDSAYLSRTPASAGNRKTWTWAGWVKRSGSGDGHFWACDQGSGASNYAGIRFQSNAIRYFEIIGGSFALDLTTNAVFRDFSAWYHIQLVLDTTQATAANRVKLYVNNVQQTFTGSSYPTQNADLLVNTASYPHSISSIFANGRQTYFDGYLADIHFIDGQALTPSSFTEVSATTGQLIPKAYTGPTPTGNSSWLPFSDNSAATATTLGKDNFNLGNNWTPNNLSVTAGAGNDSLVDTPTSYGTDTGAGGEVRGNYCTWSTVDKQSNTTLSNGNLEVNTGGAANQGNVRGTFGMSSGKWYWEITPTSLTDGGSVGVQASSQKIDNYLSSTWVYVNDGTKSVNNTYPAYGASWTTGDVIGIALDCDAGILTFYKNGASQGTAFNTGLTGITLLPWLGDGNSGSSTGSAFTANFGQRPFAYTAPSGFKALCDTNLPAPVVAKPNTVMDVKLYTGNGGTQTISGMGFSPDLVWIKCRSTGGTAHVLQDVVRGPTAYLVPNSTAAENTNTANDWFRAFTSDGFTVAASTTGGTPTSEWNASSSTYVAWTWDAGSSTVTNTQGSITSQVRANATSGFSVATYTGTGANATVGHGLGVAPGLVIVKCRSAANDWAVYHSANTSDPKTDYLLLNSTAATADDNTYWNDTAPTSTVFSIGTNADVNTNTATYVAYCWAPQVGYSSFGSYVGNGSASDGPFVYTGFRPRWVLMKDATTGDPAYDYWFIWDTARNTYNVSGTILYPNASDAESTSSSAYIDILSNGFKVRNSFLGINQSSQTVIYAAFAESPFQFSRAR